MHNNFSSRELRDALGCFSTGVAVVTTTVTEHGKATPLGMTVNSFASVSLDPPLVLWSLSKDSTSYEAFASAPSYNIHILKDSQKSLSDKFAMSDQDRFDGVDWAMDEKGLPQINHCKAFFQCNLEQAYEGGDHVILVGRVSCLSMDKESAPLVFAQGMYRELKT